MKAETIEGVIARVLAGDIQAYAELVRRHQREVWRVVAFALRDRAGTEDLVQQTFVVAYRELDRYDAERDFGAWLRGIARNLARQELRRKAREDRRMSGYLKHLEATAGSDEEADDREQALRVALADCRKQLSDAARRALELRYDRALDFNAVAETIGRTVAGARQLLWRTRLQLRDCIQEKLA